MQYNGIPFIQSSVCPGNEAYYVLGKTADAKEYQQKFCKCQSDTNKTQFSVCCTGKQQDKLEVS